MAAALYEKYSGVSAMSAGTKVPQAGLGKEGKELKDIPVAEPVIRCMQEKENIDVSKNINKSVTPVMVEAADNVIIMAEEETVPEYLLSNEKSQFWTIEDPLGKTYEGYCQVMEQIKTLVLDLIASQKT